MKQPHVHKDVMIAAANGAQVEYKNGDEWIYLENPSFIPETEYRIKPEREFPVTSIQRAALCDIYSNAAPEERFFNADALEIVANAAIKQHILDQEQK